MNSGAIGALVIGGEHPGLGIARSLGRRGIPVCVIDDQLSISRFSKYVDRFVRVNDLRDDVRTVDSVLEAGRRYGMNGWVLFPTRDETVAAFARHRTRLAQFFRVTTAPWETVQWAWDKKNTYYCAEQLGIPVPRTYNPASERDLEGLYQRLPLAIKPAVKENFFYATGDKAWRADTPHQLRCLYHKALRQIRPEEILVQEIIPGDGKTQYSYCAFFRDGQAHSTLMARRVRQHPREFGRAATYVETTEIPEIGELAERFLRAINYHGVVEIEFKQDPRDGHFKLLDVNARTWGFHALGAPAGVDFPYLVYADQIGDPIKPCKAKPGVGWLRCITDLPTVVSDIWDGEFDARSYWESLRHTQVESVFSRHDPLPSLAEIVMLPYLLMKKCALDSSTTIRDHAADNPGAAEPSVNESW